MANVIEIKGLCKSFADVKAVDDLSFEVREGELFAFLGVNGAGKSTTISIMCGQLRKDGGELYIDGKNVETEMDKIKDTLGIVYQNSVLDMALSVKDNLELRAALYGIVGGEFKKRLAELSSMLDFEKLHRRTVGKLSGGQRRRIDIARALIHRPSILILDEPTTGLDPQTRKLMWNVIETLRREENMTVLLTTHYMEEAADADYVVVIDAGKVVAKGTPIELKNAHTGDFITMYDSSEEEIMSLGVKYEKVNDYFRVEVENTAKATRLIVEHPELFRDYEITKGRMDDVFLSVTGKKPGGKEND